MRKRLAIFVACSVLTLCVVPVFAHHAFEKEFDWKKPATMSGTVTKFEWASPHTHLNVDVKDANGAIANWNLELGGVTALTKHGWTKATVKVGDQITVDGWLARDGRKTASAKSVKLANGKELWGASAFFDEPLNGSN